MKITFTLNGMLREVEAAAGKKVLDILKELRVNSVRKGCDEDDNDKNKA